MKHAAFFPALVLVFVAGCADQSVKDQPIKMANADACKVMPSTTDSSTGNAPKNATALQQRFAQADLETSRYRMRNLQTNPANNPIEDTLRECDKH
jgi:hypothetical protein